MAVKRKKIQQKHYPIKIILLTLGTVFVLAWLAVLTALTAINWQRLDAVETEKIRTLIIDAVEVLNNDPVVEPLSGKVYLPDAKLVLPPFATDENIRFEYSYSPAADGQVEEVRLSSKSNMEHSIGLLVSSRTYEETFERVPELQACSRQILLQYEPYDGPDYVLVHTKKLSNQRDLYMYNEKNCKKDASRLTDYLKQVESY